MRVPHAHTAHQHRVLQMAQEAAKPKEMMSSVVPSCFLEETLLPAWTLSLQQINLSPYPNQWWDAI